MSVLIGVVGHVVESVRTIATAHHLVKTIPGPDDPLEPLHRNPHHRTFAACACPRPRTTKGPTIMAKKKKKAHRTAKQRAASRRNIRKAQRAAARKKRTTKQIAAAKRNLRKGRRRR